MKLYPIFIRHGEPNSYERLITQCFLITEDKKIVAFGQAFKRPEDNFDRKKGLKIALGRAIKAYQTGLHRPNRWNSYPKASRSEPNVPEIPYNVAEKIHLDHKEFIDVLSDEEIEFENKFKGFSHA